MPVPTMPSLPPRDGVDAPPCAGLRAGTLTVSTDATLNSVVGPSLPLPTTGERGHRILRPKETLRLPWHRIPLTAPWSTGAWGGIVHEPGPTTTRVGRWHPRPRHLGRQRQHIPLTITSTWGGGEFTSLPLPPTGEHNAIGGLSGAFGTRGSISPLGWVDGTLARFLWGVNAISFPSPRHVL